MHAAGATVIGVDSSTDLFTASELFHHKVPIQGNISPDMLRSPWEKLSKHVDDVIEAGKNAPGHVLNLGHGVPADTDPDVLTRITEHIHRFTS
jgi:uroporphyrinogen decarboxylase